MSAKWSVLIFIFTFTSCLAEEETTTLPEETPISYEGAQLLWICTDTVDSGGKAPRPQILDRLSESSGLEFWGQNETCWQYLAPNCESTTSAKKELETAGLTVTIAIADLQRVIDDENPPPTSELNHRDGHQLTWTMYHRLADIYSYVDYLAGKYSSFVSVGTLGSSVEGRPIKYVKVSSGSPNPKSIWIDGGIHAREWISPAAVTYILQEIVENRDNYEKQLEGVDFYVVPVLNPDGYEYTHTRDRLWRKNRSKGGYFCQGTDLNRNWGFRWGGKGASKQPCQEIYGGRGPFSEPETQSVSSFIRSSVHNAKGFVTFHSYGQYILYPYGYDDSQLPNDHADLDRVGRKMAAAIRQVGGSQYTVGNSASLLYPASGGADDWAKGVANIKYSYTIELRDRGRYGFVLPAQFIIPTGKEAFAAIRILAAEVQALH